MQREDKIYLAGHGGLVGSALLRRLESQGFRNVVHRTHDELELRDQAAVEAFFAAEKPDHVILAASRVGGIHANNTYRAEFIYDNLMIQANVVHAAWRHGVDRLLFLGSSCVYPRDCPQPMREEYLLGGPLEATNEPYAIAKIAGIKMCEAYNDQYGTNFVSVMPTNLYGMNDNFDLANSHVFAAIIRKVHEAKQRGDRAVTLWGTGAPLREFLYVDDLADAVLFIMNRDELREMINIGSGEEVSIRELAELVVDVVGFRGELRFDTSMPDGTPRKLLDCSRLHALGWRPATGLREGLERTYAWYVREGQYGFDGAAAADASR